MKRLLTSLAICATLALSSCGMLNDTLDKGGDVGKDLVTHTTDELGKLKTETLAEVRATVEEMMPEVVESILNADAIAFLIVSVVALGSLVVIVALLLLLGTARAWWKRLRSRSKTQAANT